MLKDKLSINTDKNVFFTSDTHFYHEAIIKFCNRPFDNVTEMNEQLIQNWNNVVKEDDLVFHLGDFAFSSEKEAEEIIKKLNGTIYLVPGNHDKAYFYKIAKRNPDKLKLLQNIQVVVINGLYNIVLSHYPILCYAGSNRGVYQFYGHVHSGEFSVSGFDLPKLKYLNGNQYDVGVDNNNFTPKLLKDIITLLDNSESE